MQFIYPDNNAIIYVPRVLSGKKSAIVFEVAHQNPAATVYWQFDDEYIGATKKDHTIVFSPNEGNHKVTLVDDKGNILTNKIKVLSR